MQRYLEQVRTENQEFFGMVLKDKNGNDKYVGSYVVTLDYETVLLRDKQNYVISEQTAVLTQDSVSLNFILVRNDRRTLKQVVRDAVASVHGGDFPAEFRGNEIVVYVVFHFGIMELSCLKDRDQPYIEKRLQLIRKTVTTDGFPIKFKVEGCQVHLHLIDTYLLAPDKYKSLDALSGLLHIKGIRKLRISPYYKSRMDTLLKRYPRLFRRYALMDTVVTAGLFFNLQTSLNEQVYGPGNLKKVFRTLASATTAAFMNRNPWFKEYRDALDHERFIPAYGMAKQSFHGGLNSNFYIGRSENPDECFLDLDFMSAYPSAAMLCPLLDDTACPIVTPVSYRFNEQALINRNIPETVINKVREALYGC